jgi:multidrug resistance protein MdtO
VPTFSQRVVSDLNYFWQEMAFSPKRMSASLRLALSIALAALALLILQPPMFAIAPSVYMLFLVPHDTPQRCLGGLIQCVGAAFAGTFVALSLIIVTGNHPVARVLGLAACTFLATYFFRASVLPLASLSFASVAFMVISLWEIQIRAEQVLHLSLWPLGTLSTVALCSLAVEFLLNQSDPLTALKREMRVRFEAVEQLFILFKTNAGGDQIERQSVKLKRYAVTGQAPIQALLTRIGHQQTITKSSLETLEKRTHVMTRLIDLGAAFSIHRVFGTLDPARLERICAALATARKERYEEIVTILGAAITCGDVELGEFEQGLREMAEPAKPSEADPARLSPAPPAPRRTLLVPDAFTNPAYFIYAFKISLCATICYVIYNGLGWPGISTSYFTVLFTGLTTTGATNRKLLWRFIGSAIGGLILGIGCLAFVFPNIESVTGFLIVIAAVTFIAAWVAASPYFSYIGLQIAFSFYLLAFERLSVPTEITPARDRLLGIALGLIVMFIIFQQVEPERTVDTMRRLLARILHAEAELVLLMDVDSANLIPSPQRIAVRAKIEQLVAAQHDMADVVNYEYEPDRLADVAISNEIIAAMSTSADMMLSLSAWPKPTDVRLFNGELKALRDQLADGLHSLGRSLEQAAWNDKQSTDDQPFGPLQIARPAIAQKTLDSYRQLQMFCEGVVSARV